jgi:hypothetical protein
MKKILLIFAFIILLNGFVSSGRIVSESTILDFYCGDGICQENENFNFCPEDCPAYAEGYSGSSDDNGFLIIVLSSIIVILVIIIVILYFEYKKKK